MVVSARVERRVGIPACHDVAFRVVLVCDVTAIGNARVLNWVVGTLQLMGPLAGGVLCLRCCEQGVLFGLHRCSLRGSRPRTRLAVAKPCRSIKHSCVLSCGLAHFVGVRCGWRVLLEQFWATSI